MFYCEDCGQERGWPLDAFVPKSDGKCEVCGTRAVCFDVPSRALPLPPFPDGESVPEPIAYVKLEPSMILQLSKPLHQDCQNMCKYLNRYRKAYCSFVSLDHADEFKVFEEHFLTVKEGDFLQTTKYLAEWRFSVPEEISAEMAKLHAKAVERVRGVSLMELEMWKEKDVEPPH